MISLKFECPHCRKLMKVNSWLDHIAVARRLCDACGQQILILDDLPMKPSEYKPAPAA